MQPTPPVSAFEGVKGWSQVGHVYAVWQQMAARLMPTLGGIVSVVAQGNFVRGIT